MLLTIEGKAKRKHQIKGKQPHPVVCDQWEFDILGSKRLRIRKRDCDCRVATCHHKKTPWCYLCDVGGFWQTSFLNVIKPDGWEKPVVSDLEYKFIERGKNRRSFAELDDEMIDYMHAEIRALEKAMDALAEGFESIGIHLSASKWYGPGQASATWMKGRVPQRDEWYENQPDWYLDAARESYYGGWFEVFCHGHIRGTTYEYDINSAYPSIIATLPCLEHGTYTRGDGRPVTMGDYTLVKVRVSVPGLNSRNRGRQRSRTQNIGTLLHRSRDGSISRPSICETWVFAGELGSAIRARCVDPRSIQYIEWVDYAPCDCVPPFEEIRDLYTVRLRVGKDSPLGKGSKLVYNSGYGKFAQSIGEPQFGNPVYASRITSGCRTQILDAIASHPRGQAAVAMVATDAVFFLEPHPSLPISKKLGEWELKERRNLTIFKPGVYWDDETRDQIRAGDKPKFKARGINAGQFAGEISKVDFWFKSWEDTGPLEWPDAAFESGFSMITALQALMRNDWSLAGKNDPKTMYHSSDPFRKRGAVYWDDEWKVWRTEIKYRDYNWEIGDYENVVSTPYQKRFGIEDPFSDETRESHGVTEDGTVAQLFKFLFDNEE